MATRPRGSIICIRDFDYEHGEHEGLDSGHEAEEIAGNGTIDGRNLDESIEGIEQCADKYLRESRQCASQAPSNLDESIEGVTRQTAASPPPYEIAHLVKKASFSFRR
jgi:hypothetical protein